MSKIMFVSSLDHMLGGDAWHCLLQARRGTPAVLWSDNGTKFVGAETALLTCVQKWNQEYFAAQLAVRSVRWKFIPPASPHHGGAWELLIRSFRRTFYAVLGNRRLTDEVLQTTFVLVEQILSSRPLTYVSDDPKN